jgi:hypothetical protein
VLATDDEITYSTVPVSLINRWAFVFLCEYIRILRRGWARADGRFSWLARQWYRHVPQCGNLLAGHLLLYHLLLRIKTPYLPFPLYVPFLFIFLSVLDAWR